MLFDMVGICSSGYQRRSTKAQLLLNEVWAQRGNELVHRRRLKLSLTPNILPTILNCFARAIDEVAHITDGDKLQVA